MSLYFSAAVWGSLALCACYSLEGYLPQYRTEVAAISAPAPTQPILTVIPAAAR
jgi:hypothetical protein